MFKKILGLLLLPALAFSAGPFQSKRYFNNNGGLFDHISPILTPENNASAIQNFMLDDRGQLTARDGFRILNTTGTLASTSTAITGGGYHTSAVGSNFFAVVVGTHVYRTGTTFAGSYTDVTSTVVVTASASNLAQHTGLNDLEVFCNETDPPFYVPASGNALAISAVSGAKTCATYGSYLILGNTTESATNFPSRIRWSDINQVNSFPALNFFDIEPNDGDRIVSIIGFSDSVYIFKQRSIYVMAITGSDGPDAFIARPVARNIGAWAKNSLRVVPGQGIYFLAQNTLYKLSNNEGLVPVGDPIQRTFDSVNRAQWANAVAVVYPKRYEYMLSVSTTGSNNNLILVYDYVQGSWTTYTANLNMLEQAQDSTGRNVFISGDYSGNVYEQDVGDSYDNFKNVRAAITTNYTTGWLTQQTPEYNKGYKYLYIFTQVTSTAALSIQASFDYGNTYEYSQSVGLNNAASVYDTALYDVDSYALSGYQVSRFEINRSAKAIKIQFASSSTATSINLLGWTIVYSMDDWK